MPHLYPPFWNVQSVGSFRCAAAAIESLYGPIASAIRLSMVCSTVLGGPVTTPGGSQTRPSEYDGLIPRDGPPPPTSGPFPGSSVGLAAVTFGIGIELGTILGATTCTSREVNGRPSPPTLPAVGFSPGCPIRTNPTRSCGVDAFR